MSRRTVAEIRAAKSAVPLVVLTAYTVPFARALDAHADILLVGDSLGMVLYGLPDTLGVTLETMIRHGEAVMRGSQKALVAIDMPFGSYEESPQQALASATRVLAETGAQAVKLEGGEEMAATIRLLTGHGVPVMAHVGMMPQHVREQGWGCRGMEEPERTQIMTDAKAVEAAGAFCVVIENTEETLAAEITRALSIPTIGIGASVHCDGQVLVSEDMSGLNAKAPRFVKRYGALGDALSQAAASYAADVRARAFPGAEHVKKK